MLNKFLKFAVFGVFALSALSSTNANCYKNSCEKKGSSFKESCAKPEMKITGMTPGMIFGFGGEWNFKIKENSDFSYTLPAGGISSAFTFDASKVKCVDGATSADPTCTKGTLTYSGDQKALPIADIDYAFNMKRDKGYGGNVTFGYLNEYGFLGELELGYKKLKYKDANYKSTMETNNVLGLLRGTYYLDLGSMIYPYLTGAVGLSRINAKGTIYGVTKGDIDSTLKYLDFKDLQAIKIAGDAGIGIATMMDNAILSLGVKAAANKAIKDNFYTASFNGKQSLDSKGFSFGQLTQRNYAIEAKFKMLLS
jgi:hypothetical protein